MVMTPKEAGPVKGRSPHGGRSLSRRKVGRVASNEIEVNNLVGVSEKREEEVRRAVSSTLYHLLDAKESVSIEINLVLAETMREINERYRGMDKESTVLSFSEPIDVPMLPNAPRSLGEVFLAPTLIERKGEDLTHLVIHGVMHLLGYTHDEENDTMEMERKEEEVFRHLTIDH